MDRTGEKSVPTITTETNELVWTKPASKLVPGQVRALLKAFLRERRGALRLELSDDFVDDVILTASELTTNAVDAHKRAGAAALHEPITFKARVEEARGLWAGVWDCTPDPPVARPMLGPDDLPVLDESGRGLGIALAFAAELKVTWTPPKGKWVWSRFTFS